MKKTLILVVLLLACISMGMVGCTSQNNTQQVFELQDQDEITEVVNTPVLDEIVEEKSTEENVVVIEKDDSPAQDVKEESNTSITEVTNSNDLSLESVGMAGISVELTDVASGKEITGYSNVTKEDVVLAKGENTIVGIGAGAFKNLTTIKSIDLSSLTDLTYISEKAFSGCTNLTTIKLPSSVTSFGKLAFYQTKWLDVQRANSDQRLVIVNNVLVDGKTAEGDITIPDTVTSIAPSAFSYNYKMTSLTTGASSPLVDIPEQAFCNCVALKTVTIPTIKTIGERAFMSCKKLTTISMSNLNTIGNMSFANCVALTALDFVASQNFKSIDYGAFMGCSKIETVNFGNSIETIGIAAFYQCESLNKIEFSSSNLASIGDGAFQACSKLATVTGINSASIGIGAFFGTKYSSGS